MTQLFYFHISFSICISPPSSSPSFFLTKFSSSSLSLSPSRSKYKNILGVQTYFYLPPSSSLILFSPLLYFSSLSLPPLLSFSLLFPFYLPIFLISLLFSYFFYIFPFSSLCSVLLFLPFSFFFSSSFSLPCSKLFPYFMLRLSLRVKILKIFVPSSAIILLGGTCFSRLEIFPRP